MNLNKFSKADLISKLEKESKNHDSKNSVLIQIKSYLSQIWKLIITFKDILVKLTFLKLVISIFRKYKIFRLIWKLINSIVMTIFGISLLENIGVEFIQNLFKEIRFILVNIIDYLSNTHFFAYLNKLFSGKEDILPSKETNKIGSMSKEHTNNEWKTSESKGNPKISEWLKPDPEPEIKDNSIYKKYLIIAGVIISASLTWYYFDEISSTFSSVMEWILSFQRGPSDSEGGSSDNIPTHIGPTFPIDSVSSKTDSPDIELIDKTKGKNTVLTSPSLENLNEEATESWNDGSKSPSSDSSSTETIRAFSKILTWKDKSFIEKINLITFPGDTIEKVVDNEWKLLLNSDSQAAVEYVEKHFPKSDLDEYSYIEKLIKDVKTDNINFAKEMKETGSKLSVRELKAINALATKTDLWVSEMERKIKELE